jgi:4-hydroxy-3-polyprenylbenzoate decarboxylase
MWAVTTRCEPAEQIDIVRNAWSSALDPRIAAEAKAAGVTSHSKAIIEAVRPFGWKDKYPPTSALTADEARAIEAKWGAALLGHEPSVGRKSRVRAETGKPRTKSRSRSGSR